eukprot:CAMPEP_0180128716 /NCGR_PEP_ID=MMETSP0986-20121125/6928_1 /TAXON_ID=697907 /ORGANISM="non described non described, Strain CCMP2293" /LENGTH=52 /DNA_ID=CAMNT_0022068331 /DNA_START=767 /DNA_END=922 /DNA_ORIENTATION=-
MSSVSWEAKPMAPTTPPTSIMGMTNNMIGILSGAHVEVWIGCEGGGGDAARR